MPHAEKRRRARELFPFRKKAWHDLIRGVEPWPGAYGVF
jgi:hypothetical protein